jgi:cell division septum initiation protein DivIVA
MLTITDVSSKRFSTTRKGDGYEITEVHQFVGDVYETLAERDEEIVSLRGQLEEALRANADTAEPAQAERHDEDPVRQSSVSAVRLLEIATVNAEQLVAEAQAEAGALVASARADADQLAASARDEAQRVTAELARTRQQQEAELRDYRTSVLDEVAERKSRLQAQIERLETLERDNRTKLRSYFTEQLAQLEDPGHTDEAAPAEGERVERFMDIDAVA